jgi:hypothetical protein
MRGEEATQNVSNTIREGYRRFLPVKDNIVCPEGEYQGKVTPILKVLEDDGYEPKCAHMPHLYVVEEDVDLSDPPEIWGRYVDAASLIITDRPMHETIVWKDCRSYSCGEKFF